jgi:hypothetical protein
MVRRIGNYPIRKVLGSLSGIEPNLPPIISKGPAIKEPSYSITVGINEIFSLKELLDFDQNFKAAPQIRFDIERRDIEYYKVSLVVDFFHVKDIKFSYGKVDVELDSNSDEKKPQVHSIAPLKINEVVQINKEFALNPEVELVDVTTVSIGSYTSRKQYQKVHPLIIGHFHAGNKIKWELRTTEGINDIIGTQLFEFMVKQDANTKSRWKVLPEGVLEWASIGKKIKASLKGDDLQIYETNFETFSIPLY